MISDWEAALSPLHGDPLYLCHLLHGQPAPLAPVAGVLDAAKRKMRLIRHRAVVDVHPPASSLNAKSSAFCTSLVMTPEDSP